MSRLDVSSEPSMEDILASIRKIIAEEPPGSRPLPSLTAQPVAPAAARLPEPAPAKPSFSRAFDGLLPDPKLSEPKLPEPKLPKPTGRPSAFATDPFDFPSFEPTLKVAPEKSADAPSDPTPSFAAPVAAVPIVAVEPQKVDAALKSVEDQLADLLDDKPAAAPVTAEIVEPVAAPVQISKGPDFASMLLGRGPSVAAAAPAPAPEPVQEPSFTVSRAGYIPEETAAKSGDPFDFDLGPSPFEKTKGIASPEPVVAVAPAAVGAATKNIDIDEIVTAVLDSKPTLDALTVAPAPTPSPEAPASSQPAAELVSSPVTRPGWAKITEIGLHDFATSTTVESAPEPASMADKSVIEETAPATAVMVAHAPEQQNVRSMEDTVADLLRPMLRNWLHDNMPKIVERALAREMNEQNLIARKTAAE